MIIQAASMKLYAAEDVVENERGIDFFRDMKKTMEELKEMRGELKEMREVNKHVKEDITRLQKRFLQERQRIISTFVQDSKLPRNLAARRMFLNTPENMGVKTYMEMIRELNQRTHGGDMHEDARMVLAFFEPSNEEYKAIETLYQMTPKEIARLDETRMDYATELLNAIAWNKLSNTRYDLSPTLIEIRAHVVKLLEREEYEQAENYAKEQLWA